MYCSNCGKEVKDKAIVCSGCGHPVDTPGSVRSGKGWGVGTLLFLLLATLFFFPIGVVAGLLGLRDESKKVQSAVLLTVSIFMALLWTALVLGL